MMSTLITKPRRCIACKSLDLKPTTYVREFKPNCRVVKVNLKRIVCKTCGAEFTGNAEHNYNLNALKDRKSEYGSLLLGEEIFKFRRAYQLTTENAGKLLGISKTNFEKIENEDLYPDAKLTELLNSIIENKNSLELLAKSKGVVLPFFKEI